MEVFDDGVGKISVCTGFMDSVQINDTDIDIPKHRNERRNVMKDQNQNKSNNNQNSNNRSENNQNSNNKSNNNQSSSKIDRSRNS